MATNAEKIDKLINLVEMTLDKQRVVIAQNDRILEFMDALHQAWAQEAVGVQEPDEQVDDGGSDVADLLSELKDSLKPEKQEAPKPWGWDATFGKGDGDDGS